MTATLVFNIIRKALLVGAGAVAAYTAVKDAKKSVEIVRKIDEDCKKETTIEEKDEETGAVNVTVVEAHPMKKTEKVKCFFKTWWGLVLQDFDDMTDKVIKFLAAHNIFVIGAIFGALMNGESIKDSLKDTAKQIKWYGKAPNKKFNDWAAYTSQLTNKGKDMGFNEAFIVRRGARDIEYGFCPNLETGEGKDNKWVVLGTEPTV